MKWIRKKVMLLTVVALATMVMSHGTVQAVIDFSNADIIMFEQNFNDTVLFDDAQPLQLEVNGIVDDDPNGGKWIATLGEPGPVVITLDDSGISDPNDPLHGINTNGQALQVNRTPTAPVPSLSGRGIGYSENKGINVGILVATFRFIKAKQELGLYVTIGKKGHGLYCGVDIGGTGENDINVWEDANSIDSFFEHPENRVDNLNFIPGGLETSWHGIRIVADLGDGSDPNFGIYDVYYDADDDGTFEIISAGVTIERVNAGETFNSITIQSVSTDSNLPIWVDDVSLKYDDGPFNCGDPQTVYLPTDITQDCKVNFLDFAAFAEEFMKCTDPADSGCDAYWVWDVL